MTYVSDENLGCKVCQNIDSNFSPINLLNCMKPVLTSWSIHKLNFDSLDSTDQSRKSLDIELLQNSKPEKAKGWS